MSNNMNINSNHLENIQKMTLELLNYTNFLGNAESELTERIYNSLRKIIICTHFSNKQIIAVTGMQGVGKTTLIKNFYNLPDALFNISLNRSEKLPVLITESESCEEPRMQILKVEKDNDRYEVRSVVISSEEQFIEASKGDADKNIMYLEMIVPYKHTNSEYTSFMLLPGFENRGDYWEELISFSAKCSDTALFLVDSMRIAREENRKKLSDLKERFGESLIYVITKSDTKTDNNEQAKHQLMALTGTSEEKIICAGAYNTSEENDKWINELKNAINSYSNDPQTTRNYCTQYICDEIQNNTRPIILELKGLLRADDGNLIASQLENSSWLNAFDKYVSKMRKQYRSILEDSVQARRNESLEYVNTYFMNQGILKSAKRVLIGTTVKDVIRIQELISDSVYNGKKLKVIDNCRIAISDLASYIKENNDAKWLLTETPFENKNEMNLVLKNDAKPILNNVKILLQKNCDSELLEGNKVTDSLKVLVELATCYYCSSETSSINTITNPNLATSNINTSSILDSASNAKQFGLSMLGILGVDSLDGDSDITETISKALDTSSKNVAIGLGAIAIIGAGMSIARDINRIGREDLAACTNAVNSIYDNIISQCLENYDEYMSRIRDTVEDNLISNTTEQHKALDKYNANCLINKIENELRYFLTNIRGNSYGIRSAFDRANTMAN